MGDSPGFNINFESAPFKLTSEYVDIMGGVDSMAFKQFEDLFLRGFVALQKHVEGITAIIQVYIFIYIIYNIHSFKKILYKYYFFVSF